MPVYSLRVTFVATDLERAERGATSIERALTATFGNEVVVSDLAEVVSVEEVLERIGDDD